MSYVTDNRKAVPDDVSVLGPSNNQNGPLLTFQTNTKLQAPPDNEKVCFATKLQDSTICLLLNG